MHDMISLPPPAEFMGKARRDVGLVEATISAFTAMNLGRACGRLHLYLKCAASFNLKRKVYRSNPRARGDRARDALPFPPR